MKTVNNMLWIGLTTTGRRSSPGWIQSSLITSNQGSQDCNQITSHYIRIPSSGKLETQFAVSDFIGHGLAQQLRVTNHKGYAVGKKHLIHCTLNCTFLAFRSGKDEVEFLNHLFTEQLLKNFVDS